MLNNKLDLRVFMLTFILNNKIMLEENFFDKLLLQNRIDLISRFFNIINKKVNINNLDEVFLLLNKYYKKNEYNNYEIKELYFIDKLGDLANEFISTRDNRFILKYWKCEEKNILDQYNDINRIAIWNSFSRQVVVDNIVFQYMINKGLKENKYLSMYHSFIHIEDLQLEKILSKGVAETHLHINAGINFEIKWLELISSDIMKLNLNDINIASYGELTMEEVIYMLKQATIIRFLLANFIFNRGIKEKFYEFYKKNNLFENDECKFNCKYSLDNRKCEYMYFKNNINNLLKFDLNNNIDEWLDELKLKNIYNFDCDNEKKSWEELLRKRDWINSISCRTVKGTSLENIFLFECFKTLDKKKQEYSVYSEGLRNDKIFIKLFYKYILIKNIIYSITNEDNKIKGLDKFVKNFSMSTKLPVPNYMKNIKMILSLHCQLQNKNLSKFEFRCSFPSKHKQIAKMEKEFLVNLKSFFEFYNKLIEDIKLGKLERNVIPKMGIIYHFIKYKDNEEKCWINYLNDEYSKSLYYIEQRRIYEIQIDILTKFRNKIPYLSKYLVGIDTASVEHYTEPWVFAPIFKKARENEQRLLVKNERLSFSPISSLGFTFHVGEEFRHIVTGLRNIYEVINNLNFRAGDRIGHGIALGIDLEKWIKNNEIIILPRIEYLENLLWVWNMYTDKNSCIEYDINYIEREILTIAQDIYGEESFFTVKVLYDAYISKFKEYKIDICKVEEICDLDVCINKEIVVSNDFHFCNNFNKCEKIKELKNKAWNLKKLRCANHCKIYLKRMNEPIEIKISMNDIRLFKDLQNRVKKMIIEKGIVVETNPTSNRVIGQIENIFEHYISRLNDTTQENNMLVTINTDDPCVFNSNINNEYAYIFYSLLHKGYDRSLVLNWIDEVRQIALDNSFIRDRGLNEINQIDEEIKEILKELELYIN
ncbi:hypothetical protein KCK31_000554 [Clostridium perfringens]|nr:hypothetical protein [Clostridium perfringens]